MNCGSILDRAAGKAGDQVILGEQHEQGDRDHGDHAACGCHAEVREVILGVDGGQCQRDRVVRSLLHENNAVGILVPGVQEGEHGHGRDAGGDQREHDLDEQLPLRRAVDPGGFLDRKSVV